MVDKKEMILNIICLILILSVVLSIIDIILLKKYDSFFWLCYTGAVIISIGIIKKKPYLILSQILILAIPNILWIIDFLYILLTGNSLFQLSTFFFENKSIFSKIISLQHLYVIPLAIYALYSLKINNLDKRKALQFALIQLIIFFVLGLMFTTIENNINCIYELCFDITLINLLADNIPYSFGWFLIMYFTVLLVYFIIIKIPLFKDEDKK